MSIDHVPLILGALTLHAIAADRNTVRYATDTFHGRYEVITSTASRRFEVFYCGSDDHQPRFLIDGSMFDIEDENVLEMVVSRHHSRHCQITQLNRPRVPAALVEASPARKAA
jgi:hypothetical protein